MESSALPSWRVDSIKACIRELREEAADVDGPGGDALKQKIDNLEGGGVGRTSPTAHLGNVWEV